MPIPSSPEQWAAIEPNESDEEIEKSWFEHECGASVARSATVARLLERERISNEDRTGSGIIKCHACGEEFWVPGTLNIALHANEEWRNAFEARIRSNERERCVEALANSPEVCRQISVSGGLLSTADLQRVERHMRLALARRILGVES